MTQESSSTLVLPPAGPLQWLYPELGRFETSSAGLDLSTAPLQVADLTERSRGGASISVPDGPRGRVFSRVLRQAVRPRDCRIEAGAQLEEFAQRLGTAVLAVADVGAGQVWTVEGRWCAPGELAADEIGVLPLRPGSAAADLARGLGLPDRVRGRVVPVWLTDPEPAEDPTTRLAEGFWGLLPGDRYPSESRRAWHSLVRKLWPSRYQRFRAYENQALAGFDVYEEMLRGRPIPPAVSSAVNPAENSAETERRPLIVGIDGIDGAGKSSQIEALRSHLEGRGQRVAVHKIYRHGVFHDTVTDLTRQCDGGRNLHLWQAQRHIKLFDSIKYFYSVVQPGMADHDVLIFDRYVQTHFAAGLGRYGHDPYARELMGVFPPADRVYVLDLPEATALERIARRKHRTVDENPYMLSRFRRVLLEQVDGLDVVRLDATTPMADLAGFIRDDVAALLGARS